MISKREQVMRRRCKASRADGEQCGMAPMGDSEFCWAHDPANAEAAAEARRLGGMRHKREGTVAGAHQFEGLGNVQDIRRLIQIAVLDTLGMENSIQRSRTLAYLAQTALKSLEVGEVQERLGVLEESVLGRRVWHFPLFDDDDEDEDDGVSDEQRRAATAPAYRGSVDPDRGHGRVAPGRAEPPPVAAGVSRQ